MNGITIHTTGKTEIFIQAPTGQKLTELITGEVREVTPRPEPGHTKVLADGNHAPADSSRTDHVAIIDHATGLMWSAKSIGDSDGEPMSQADCEKACAELHLLGHDDWRLPTRAELAALVDDTRHEPAIDTGLFPGVLARWHWTSTAAAWSSASAWLVYFVSGSVLDYPRSYVGFALAVRRAGQ